MKKTLAALAVLGAFAGTAAAADVTLYGVVDTGLGFTYSKTTDFKGKSVEKNTFEMANGINAGSRFGLRGTEELGNGFKVGFKLENGFNSDDGTLKAYNEKTNRLFGREASLTIYTPHCGQVSFGRMGGVGSAAGTYDVVYANADAFDGGDWQVLGLQSTSRYDNMITYQTPKVVGLQATLQYSFKTDSNEDKQVEGRSTAERYGAIALTGEYGPVTVVASYEQNINSTTKKGITDGRIVNLGGNVDLGVATLFAMAQYYDAQKDVLGLKDSDLYADDGVAKHGAEGYGFHLGTVVPVAGGDLTVGAYYVDGKVHLEEDHTNFGYIGLATRYGYALSKRTTAYVGGGYAEAKVSGDADEHDYKQKIGSLYVGLTHTF